jgi:phage terminase large subunit-like protein
MTLKTTDSNFDADVLNYCNDILSGKINSGIYAKKAIERFVFEYTVNQKKNDYDYVFVPEYANEVIRFAESLYIPDIEKKLNLLPWHKFIYYNLYGWVYKNDQTKRRFRSGFVCVARKNSKTTSLMYPIILYDFKNTKSAEAFFVSASEKQAYKSFQELKSIIDETFKVDNRAVTMTESGIRKNGALITFFSAGSRDTDQYKNSCSVIDEFHDYDNKGEKIITAFRYGSRARKNSLVLIITSAGLDISGPCYAEDLKARKILNGVLKDDSYFTIIYCYDDGDDWKDPDNFIKANPSLHTIIQKDVLENDLNDALITPSHQADFKSKTCGIWASGASSWIPLDKWESLDQEEVDWSSFEGNDCFGSFDLSSVNDFTAYTLCFKHEERYYLKHKFYVPSETLRERYLKENIGLIDWIDRGIVTQIPGPTIDYSFLLEDIRQDVKSFNLREIAYDAWNSRELIKMIEDELGNKLVLVPYSQNLKNMSQPTKQYEKLVFERKIIDANPVIKWMVGNVVIRPDINGNYKPMKELKSSTKRIDGIITSIIALDRAVANKNEKKVGFDDILNLF